MRKKVLTAILSMVFAVIFFTGTAQATVVTFPDENLERAIRNALNKPTGDITAADMESLTWFYAHGLGIENISGLEHAINLDYLSLSENQITDISALSNLTNLTKLWLYGNQITNISPLSNLTELTELYLYKNQISDISPLSNLIGLTAVSYTHLTLPTKRIV